MSPITMCVPIPTTDTGHPLKPGTQHNPFQDSKPEERKAATPEGHALDKVSKGCHALKPDGECIKQVCS